MAKKYDVVAGIGEYTDRQGNTKVRWLNCGSIFQTDKGFSLKLDCVPVGSDGWFKLFEPKQRQQQESPPQQDDFNDPVPF